MRDGRLEVYREDIGTSLLVVWFFLCENCCRDFASNFTNPLGDANLLFSFATMSPRYVLEAFVPRDIAIYDKARSYCDRYDYLSVD